MYSSPQYNWLVFLVSLGVYVASGNMFAEAHVVCHNNVEDALPAAIHYHQEGAVEIATTRGIPPLQEIDIDSFESAVLNYLKGVSSSAFILYAADTEHICVFLWRSDDIGLRYERIKSTREELFRLGELLRVRILVGSEQTARAPKRRGITPATETSTPADSRTTSELIDTLSGIIFPQQLRHAPKGIQSLSVAPVWNMSSLPLVMLRPLGTPEQVIDLFSVNFITFLVDLQKGTVPSHSTYTDALIIGNPRPSGDPEWIFPDLPGAEQEAELVHMTFGGMLLSREQATADSFIRGMQDASLIYIAAHAMSDPSGSLDESFIMLARDRLRASEVQFHTLICI